MTADFLLSGPRIGAQTGYTLAVFTGVVLPATPTPVVGADATSDVVVIGLIVSPITAAVDVGLTIGATVLFSCHAEVTGPIVIPAVAPISAWTQLSAGLLITVSGASSAHVSVVTAKRLR